jgi:hypothetical protein
LYFEQDLLLLTAAWYIQFSLRPAILEVLGEHDDDSGRSPVLGWEHSKWKHEDHVSMRRPLASFRAAATVGPASLLWLGAIVLRGRLGASREDWVALAEALLFLVAVIGTFTVAWLQISVQSRRYPSLSGTDPESARSASRLR